MNGRDNPRLHRTITADTLRRDRENREKARAKLATSYDEAADALDKIGGHAEAVRLLRREAEQWRK